MSLRTCAVALAALTGCAAPEVASEEPDEGLIRALSVRDPVPTCEAAASRHTGEAPLADALTVIAEQVQQPAWVAIRAAGCLAELAPEAGLPALERWVRDPQHAGLGRTVLGKLDRLPSSVARPVLHSALDGDLATVAQQRVAASARPELATIIEEH